MFLTFGLPLRHPIVIIAIINILLFWVILFVSANVVNEPSGRYPYPALVVGAMLCGWAPIYLVAHPEEMSKALFNWSGNSRIPDHKPRGRFILFFGYMFAISLTVLCIGIIIKDISDQL